MTQGTPKSIVSMLEHRARTTPHRVAYRYLGDTGGLRQCTYAQLHQAASAIAARLREGGRAGERVLLLYPPGLEFIQAFLGCVAAGAIAVPAPPPNPVKPERSLERLVSIVESAWPTWALTTSSVLSAVEPALAKTTAFGDMQWLATDTIAPVAVAHPLPPIVDPKAIALIQYTSGSTSDPKGVALSHANLAHNVDYFDEGWDHTPDSVLVSWLPAFHDLGLVYGILMPLWGGFLGIQMSPIDVIQRPFSWLEAMSTHRATHSGGPNFIYELCARKVTDEQRRTLDLSSWRMALTAAEPVRAETMERFIARFSKVGFRSRTFCPGYGLSEGTCKVAAAACSDEPTILTVRADRLEQHSIELAAPGTPARSVVGCGRPGRQVKVVVVSPDRRQPLGEDQIGELWVSGPSVAQGYWNQKAATDDCLQAQLAGGDGTPFLRTGDLGFLHRGEVFVTGRIKDVIIIRGNNHYPQDIEQTVQDANPSIRAGCCAAFPFEEDGEERLAVVAEVERRHVDGWGPSPDRREQNPVPPLPRATGPFVFEDVAADITKAVAEAHGIKVHRVELIRAGSINKTTSGKIQRKACARAMLAGTLDRVATAENEAKQPQAARTVRDEVRSQVTEIVARCGSIRREKLRPEESLHRLGVDSLAAVNIAYEIELLVGQDVPSGVMTEHDTIEKLVDYVLARRTAR